MNTNRVKSAFTKSLYPFIFTSSKRVMTVNYFNLMVILPNEESALLNFLIKESTQYNTFKYSTRLLEKYRMYVSVVKRSLSADINFNTNIKITREVFIRLIEKGLLFRVGNEYVINFALTYSPQYANQVKEWAEEHEMCIKHDFNVLELSNKEIKMSFGKILKQIRR